MKNLFTIYLMGVISVGLGQSLFMLNHQGIALDGFTSSICSQNIKLKVEAVQAGSTLFALQTNIQQSGVSANCLNSSLERNDTTESCYQT